MTVFAGLYIHVPFCVHKCGYCDFNSWAETRRAPQELWLQALEKQVKFWSERIRTRNERNPEARIQFSTVFWGGGTPSLMENDLLVQAGRLLRESFELTPNCEFSIECNPETVSSEKLEALRLAGANRLSMGVQSFDDLQLERLERRARRQDNVRALEKISSEWRGRWSLDLMFGLPKQTLESWKDQLQTGMAFAPKHLSAYQLTLTTARSQNWQQPLEDDLLEQFDFTEETLEKLRLKRYEVSNFAEPGHESQHNLKYWRLEPFLGLGPGAAGLLSPAFLEGAGQKVHPRWGAHQKQADRFETWVAGAGKPLYELSSSLALREAKDHLFEMLMMGLRLREGIDSTRIEGLWPEFRDFLGDTQLFESINFSSGRFAVTDKGLRILDTLLPEIFERFQKNAPQNLDSPSFDPKFV